MHWAYMQSTCILLFIFSFFLNGLSFSHGNLIDSKNLIVGKELWKENLPLRMGSRLYQLKGLKPDACYEVKISYPASIPARFSLQLKRGHSDFGLNWNRKLLNTEKLVFKSDADLLSDKGGIYVLVTVEPEGIVAIPAERERKDIIFNIVCDELLFGIPYQAWWVVILVVLCLSLALVIPFFLPSYLLPCQPAAQTTSKES